MIIGRCLQLQFLVLFAAVQTYEIRLRALQLFAKLGVARPGKMILAGAFN